MYMIVYVYVQKVCVYIIYTHLYPCRKERNLKDIRYIMYIYIYIIYKKIYICICDCAATNHVLFIKRQVGTTLTQVQAIRDIHVPVAIYMASTMGSHRCPNVKGPSVQQHGET